MLIAALDRCPAKTRREVFRGSTVPPSPEQTIRLGSPNVSKSSALSARRITLLPARQRVGRPGPRRKRVRRLRQWTGSVTLGYRDPDVDTAVREQLAIRASSSRFLDPLETVVAEKINDLVPCAEMVRFGKTAPMRRPAPSDLRVPTRTRPRRSLRLSRLAGLVHRLTARNRGVPKATRDLTHTFGYNDPHSLATAGDPSRQSQP